MKNKQESKEQSIQECISKILTSIENQTAQEKIHSINKISKLLDYDEIYEAFKKHSGLQIILKELTKQTNQSLDIKVPLLHCVYKISTKQIFLTELRLYEVIQQLRNELLSRNYMVVTTVINIYIELAFDNDLAQKMIDLSLKDILQLLFTCHPHNQNKVKFIDLENKNFYVAIKELVQFIFILLRCLSSYQKNRAMFKQIFIPGLLKPFIDIGNFNKIPGAYKKLIEEYFKIEPSDILCMEETLTQFDENEFLEQITAEFQDYKILQQIGKGAFGCVYLCKNGDKKYALKQINGVTTTNYKEVQIHRDLSHPNIVNFCESFIHEKSLIIIIEYIEGFNLSELIKMQQEKKQQFSEERIWKIILDIVSALQYLHVEQRIIHRDLNPTNIMIGQNWNVKICDFGLAKQIQDDVINTSFVGTLIYTCPEIVENQAYSEQADIWSLGCIIYELLQLKPAFTSTNPLTLASKIVQLDYEQIQNTPYSYELLELVSLCLQKEECNRPNIQDLIHKIAMQQTHLTDTLKVENDYLRQTLTDYQNKPYNAEQLQLKLFSIIQNILGAIKDPQGNPADMQLLQKFHDEVILKASSNQLQSELIKILQKSEEKVWIQDQSATYFDLSQIIYQIKQ